MIVNLPTALLENSKGINNNASVYPTTCLKLNRFLLNARRKKRFFEKDFKLQKQLILTLSTEQKESMITFMAHGDSKSTHQY